MSKYDVLMKTLISANGEDYFNAPISEKSKAEHLNAVIYAIIGVWFIFTGINLNPEVVSYFAWGGAFVGTCAMYAGKKADSLTGYHLGLVLLTSSFVLLMILWKF